MNDNFGAITILAPKCQQCPKMNTCDHKQMAHLGFIIPTLVNDICKPIRQSMRNNYRKDYLK
jgi:hypothetical protein